MRSTRTAGDMGAGIVAAVRWIAETLPLYSLNFVLATPDELWSLRYPDSHRLMMLERAVGGPTGARTSTPPAPRVRCGSAQARWEPGPR